MHFSEIVKLQFEKERHTLLCILQLYIFFSEISDKYLNKTKVHDK